MELCCLAATSRHPLPSPSSLSFPAPHQNLLVSRTFRRTSLSPNPARPRVTLRAAEFEEASYAKVTERVETVADDTAEEEETVIEYEEAVAEAPVGEVFDFLKDLNLKKQLDSGEVYPILLYGSGAFVALWVSSAVVGALDALPLIPKALEIIGLGYTVWFSYRYLVFKKNRDELSAKVQDLKEQILGPSDRY